MAEIEARLRADPDGAAEVIEALLGEGAARADAGVVHVCSCFLDARGVPCAIRVGPGAPRSELDGFMLRAVRAQADVIVTSGSILRHEPRLEQGLGNDATGEALRRYRSQVLGKQAPPLSLVMSSSGELDAGHPLWRAPGRVRVWTSPEGLERLRGRLPAHVEVRAPDEGTPAALLDQLRDEGHGRVSLEVGPAAVRGFYAARLVDVLWVARYLGDAPVGESQRGAPWPFSRADIEAWRLGGSGPVPQASGPWRFDRCRVPGR